MQITFITPECGSIDADLMQEVNISFVSPTDTMAVESIVVSFDGVNAVIGTDFQCGFSGTFIETSSGHYNLTIIPITSLLADHTVNVIAFAVDAAGHAIEECSFTTQCSDCLSGYTLEAIYGSGVYKIDEDGNMELLWDDSITPVNIVDDRVNAIYLKRTNNNTYVGVATDAGVSVIRNCFASFCYGGTDMDGYNGCLSTVHMQVDGYGDYFDGYCAAYRALDIYIDDLTKLYIWNATLNRIEVFYNINEDLVGRIHPDFIYDASSVPDLIGKTITGLYVVEYLSAVLGSNTLFFLTDNGLIKINTDESNPRTSEINMDVVTYGIDGSGADYEILGGNENRIIKIEYDRDNTLLAVASQNASTLRGDLTLIHLQLNIQAAFYANRNGVTDLEFLDDPTLFSP